MKKLLVISFRKRLMILCLFSLLIFKTALSQNEAFFKSPIITPASPEAKALYKFSETPLDYSSGTANQIIPLYTLKVGRIEVPISISYNTGGIKVQDIASMIGLGWTLNWGGIITERGENVSPAEQSLIDNNTIKTSADISANINNDIAWRRLDGITRYGAERQKPEYYFNFGEYSGVFFYDVNDRIYIKSGNHNLKIEKVISPNNDYYKNGFKITTDNGIEYIFMDIETALPFNSMIRKTAYLISSIRDLNSNDYINFNYETKPQFQDYSNESYSDLRVLSYESLGNSQCSWPQETLGYFNNITTIYSKRISNIQSSNGQINFIAATDRLDIDETRITDIVIKDRDYAVVKKIKFGQSYFVSNANLPRDGFRLRLDKITFYNNDITTGEEFEFSYNNIMLPAYRYNGRNATGVDYWGYYNGVNSNSGLIPQNLSNNAGFTTNVYRGDRSVSPSHTQASILQKIIYPTGGYVTFTFENNEAPTGSLLGIYAGGLRLRKSTYYATPGMPALIKEYKYYNPVIPIYQYVNNYVYDKMKTAYCTDGQGYPWPSEGASVTNYLTRFISSSPIGLFSYFTLPVTYLRVEEYAVSGARDIGKTVYTFDFPAYVTHQTSIPEYGGVIAYEKKWMNDKLLREIDYHKKDSTSSYVLFKKEINTYSDYRDSIHLIGLHAVRKAYHDYVKSDPAAGMSNLQRVAENEFFDAYNSSGIRLLTRKRIEEYNHRDTLTLITDFEYEPKKLQLRKVKTINSKSDSLTTVFKYPYDLSILTNRTIQEDIVLNTMIAKNNLMENIEQERYVPTKLLERKRVVFKNTNFNFQSPDRFLLQIGTNAVETKTYFTQYSSNNKITEYKDNNGIYKSVIWDDAEIYPIAEIINATQTDIAYTSFEYTSTSYSGKNFGNWIVNYNGPFNSGQTNIPMGRYSFPISATNTITRNNLNAATTYYISYWSSNGSCSITGTTHLEQGRTVSGWTNYIHTVSGINTVTVKASSGFYIDELRLYPSNAQMTTYNYLPLVGVNRICDTRDKFTYYEYDDMGNLLLIKDLDKNVIKRFARRNKELINNPNSLFANAETYKVFTKNCTTGGTGSKVIYTIPTGTFISTISQADADLKAENELIQNGPAYANQHGVCLYYSTKQSKKFYKNNCSTDSIGTYSVYTVPDSTYSSTISQDDANLKALNYLSASGQLNANEIGTCVLDIPNLNIKYINQSTIYWNVTATNVVTGSSFSGTIGSYYNGTIFASLPKGTYNIIFSSFGMTIPHPTVFTVNDTTAQIPANTGGDNISVAFDNVLINAVSESPLIRIYEILSEQSCGIAPSFGWEVGSNNMYKVSSGARVYFYAAFKKASKFSDFGPEVVANIGSSCVPGVNRIFNYVGSNNRTWEVKIASSGQLSLRLINGTIPAANEEIYITGEYSQ